MKNENMWFTMGHEGDPNCFDFQVSGARFKAVRLLFPMGQYDTKDDLSIHHCGGYDRDQSPIFYISRSGVDTTYGGAKKYFQEMSVTISGVEITPTGHHAETLEKGLEAARPDYYWVVVLAKKDGGTEKFPYAFAGQRGCAEVYAILPAAAPK